MINFENTKELEELSNNSFLMYIPHSDINEVMVNKKTYICKNLTSLIKSILHFMTFNSVTKINYDHIENYIPFEELNNVVGEIFNLDNFFNFVVKLSNQVSHEISLFFRENNSYIVTNGKYAFNYHNLIMIKRKNPTLFNKIVKIIKESIKVYFGALSNKIGKELSIFELNETALNLHDIIIFENHVEGIYVTGIGLTQIK